MCFFNFHNCDFTVPLIAVLQIRNIALARDEAEIAKSTIIQSRILICNKIVHPSRFIEVKMLDVNSCEISPIVKFTSSFSFDLKFSLRI